MRVMALAVVVITLGAAVAAPRCASPDEVKLLKAAMLEQVLTAARQSCRLDTDYSRFVAAYHAGMVKSDRSLKSFFASGASGEGYDGYKSRIAAAVSFKSLHDPNFCADAKALFDIALHRKAGPAPALIATGYENCAMPAAQKPPLVVLLHRKAPPPAALQKPPVQAQPPAAAMASIAVPRPRPVLAAAKPMPLPQAKTAPPRSLRVTAPLTALEGPQHSAPQQPGPSSEPAGARLAKNRLPPNSPEPVAEKQEPVWNEEASPYLPGDPTPNAYKPGAVWVRTDLPVSPVPPARYQPRPPQPNLYLGIDGRWHVMIGHRRYWEQ